MRSVGDLVGWCLCAAVATACQTATPAPPAARGDAALNLRVDWLKLPPMEEVHSGVDLRARLARSSTVAVAFVGTECPITNQYMDRLEELHTAYEARGVSFVAIYSNVQESLVRVVEHANAHKLSFPVVRDTKNQLADAFHATVTPEAFVVDGEGQLVYHGRIDDQYAVGQRKEAPTKRELVSALDDVLAGRPVAVDAVAAAGCTIIRERGPQPETGRLTYTRDVAPIVQEKCQGCHRPGHVGPMSLMTYDDVVSWSDNIHARVKARIMPPWGANNHFGAFRNNRGLSDEQYATILSWIDEGSPLGDPKDMPPPRQFKDGWGIANPDIVVPVAEAIHVPATGTFPYQYVWVDHDFTEDTWVNEAELRSTTPTVAHHIIAMVVYPEELPKGKLPKLTARTMGRNLAGLAIGGDPAIDWGAGFAKKIPKGSKLYFEIHYTPNGTAQVDRPIIGLKTIKNPKSEVITGLATSRKIHIPPFQDDYEVVSEFEFKEAGRILAMAPHMHKRGKDFRFDLTYPDGRTETVLDVTRYDFNMPTNYFPTEPIVAPQGTKVRCTAHYDNSERNVINPDPTATVEVGPQTDDEMMIGFIDLAYDLPIGDKRVLALNPAAETDQ